MRRRVASNTVMRTFRHTNSSPTTGMCPSSLKTKPPMVSKSASSGKPSPSRSLSASMWTRPRASHAPSPSARIGSTSSLSYSSTISPHDLFQHVLHGHDAGDAAVFVQAPPPCAAASR